MERVAWALPFGTNNSQETRPMTRVTHRRLLLASMLASAFAAPLFAHAADAKEIRIAHVYSKTGPLEAYGKQTQTGLMMGLDYATNGTMTVNGKKLVVI